MTPRRPAPARPGVRPGTRRGARTASRSGPEQQTPPPDAAAPPPGPDSSTDRTDRGGQPPERTVLRLGGIDGMAVPAHAISLALVLLLAFVVVFPSLRGYLSQRARYDAVVNEIADARATSSALEEEAARWQDEDYVRSQARERLSYVMPGETTYVVVGADQVGSGGTGDASEMTDETERSPWYEVLRDSARTAGGDEEGMSAVDPARQGWPTLSPAASDAPAAPGASDPAPTGR